LNCLFFNDLFDFLASDFDLLCEFLKPKNLTVLKPAVLTNFLSGKTFLGVPFGHSLKEVAGPFVHLGLQLTKDFPKGLFVTRYTQPTEVRILLGG
jgi:hypothetical protein